MLEFQYILCCGSTENRISGIPLPSLFQYILCCGSTGFYDSIIITSYNFNTSYVAVQQLWNNIAWRWTWISIHLMLRFNAERMTRFMPYINFNTSYVAVQRNKYTQRRYFYCYFNTSYVAVQPPLGVLVSNISRNFNTSYVAVQL